MSNPQNQLSREEVSLLELFEKLTPAQKDRVAAIVADRVEGRVSHTEFKQRLRDLSAS